MANFFEVTVAIKTEGEKGKIKTIREVYLVDAMTLTEAEARVIKDFVKSGFSQDYNVVSAKESKIVSVIYAEKQKEEE